MSKTKKKKQQAQLRLFGLPPEPDRGEEEGGATLAERMRAMQKLTLVQVAPGVWRHTGNGQPPEIVIARVLPNEDGTFRLVPAYEQWMRLCRENVLMIGMQGQWHTLMRLGRGGFIEVAQVAPRLHFLNLTTWWGHIAQRFEAVEDQHTPDGKKRLGLYRKVMY